MITSIPYTIYNPKDFRHSLFHLKTTCENYVFEDIPSELDFKILNTDRVVIKTPSLIIVLGFGKTGWYICHEYSIKEQWCGYGIESKLTYNNAVGYIKKMFNEELLYVESCVEFYKRKLLTTTK